MDNDVNIKKFIKSASPFFGVEATDNILEDIRCILNDGILTDGKYTREFENLFAQYINVNHSIAVNSGTSALEIPLRHFNILGKEVIVPTNTFVATPNSVLHAGGKPVFADIDENTLCINLDDIKNNITSKTTGIIVVHIAGLICPDMKEITELCEDKGFFLIEDAAHAHGAMYYDKKAGNLADVGCFSFYPTKVMTSGEGGMITTNMSDLNEVARSLRNHGQNNKRLMVRLGHNWRMNEISALIGKYQLLHIEDFVKKRNNIAFNYNESLINEKNITLFETPKNIRHSYYKYPVKLSKNMDVDKIQWVLFNKYNIETGNIYYPPCHMHPFYLELEYNKLAISEETLKRVICLPMHYNMTDADVQYVIDSFKKTIKNNS